MVFLATSPTGLRDALRISSITGEPVWCGANAISESEYRETNEPNLSRFNYEIKDQNAIAGALQTIQEHHPERVIWIEG